MEVWIGPAIVAAIVAALVNVAGWIVTFRQSRAMEQLRRDEKVHDFQVALRAEIESDLDNMRVVDRAALLVSVKANFSADPTYTPFVPHLAKNVVFDAIVPEVHILPGDVIAPVIKYARLRQTLERFIDDLRSEQFRKLLSARQLTMCNDYLATLGRLQVLAERAAATLTNSLSSSAAGLSSPMSGAGQAGSAMASGQGVP